MDNKELVENAQSQLDRILGFFPRVDGKGSVLLAVNTGMLGFLAAQVLPFHSLTWWQITVPAISVVLLGTSLWFLYRGAFPTLDGGHQSLVYFREIAARTEAKFVDEFSKQTVSEYAKDILGQVWRNSEILKAKFDSIKWAFIFLALAIPPWVASLVILSIKAAATKVATP